jgi:hypothetical protein
MMNCMMNFFWRIIFNANLCGAFIVRFIVFTRHWVCLEVQWIDIPMNSADIEGKCLMHIKKIRTIWVMIFVINVVTLYILDILSMPKHLIMSISLDRCKVLMSVKIWSVSSNLASNKLYELIEQMCIHVEQILQTGRRNIRMYQTNYINFLNKYVYVSNKFYKLPKKFVRTEQIIWTNEINYRGGKIFTKRIK